MSMTKDDPITGALVDKFFGPVIDAESEQAIRNWLKDQSTEEIERFLNHFNWAKFRDRETILRQEIRRRKEAELKASMSAHTKDTVQRDEDRPAQPESLKITKEGIVAIGRFPIVVIAGIFLVLVAVFLVSPDARQLVTSIFSDQGPTRNGEEPCPTKPLGAWLQCLHERSKQ